MKTTLGMTAVAIMAVLAVLGLSVSAWADQITLAPNGAGDLTQLNVIPGASVNWQDVLANDGDTTCVQNAGNDWMTDLYSLEDPAVSGTINWLRVYTTARSGRDPERAGLLTAVKTGGTIYSPLEADAEWLTTSYGDYYTEYSTNPAGGNWTWTQIADLQAGVVLRKSIAPGTGGGTPWSRVTRVWVVVDYTPSAYEGLSHGYWKNHTEDWPPTGYSPSQTLASVFAQSSSYGLGSYTLLQALDFTGGNTLTEKAQILLRNAVAALLNAAHPGIDYPLTEAQVIAQVNAALASGDAATMLELETTLDGYNNLGGSL